MFHPLPLLSKLLEVTQMRGWEWKGWWTRSSTRANLSKLSPLNNFSSNILMQYLLRLRWKDGRENRNFATETLVFVLRLIGQVSKWQCHLVAVILHKMHGLCPMLTLTRPGPVVRNLPLPWHGRALSKSTQPGPCYLLSSLLIWQSFEGFVEMFFVA